MHQISFSRHKRVCPCFDELNARQILCADGSPRAVIFSLKLPLKTVCEGRRGETLTELPKSKVYFTDFVKTKNVGEGHSAEIKKLTFWGRTMISNNNFVSSNFPKSDEKLCLGVRADVVKRNSIWFLLCSKTYDFIYSSIILCISDSMLAF